MTAARTGNVATRQGAARRAAPTSTRAKRSKGQTALMWAAAENNAAAVKLLVEAGADRQARGRRAARSRRSCSPFAPVTSRRRARCSTPARNVNETLPDGTSALVLAAINAHYELAAVLLDRGADPNADAQGWTALHQIAWSRRHNAGFNLPGPGRRPAASTASISCASW